MKQKKRYLAFSMLVSFLFMLPATRSVAKIRLTLSGPETVVFQWSRDKCDDSDTVDTPVRAYRRSDGLIVMFASHFRTRALVGPTLQKLKRDCRIVLNSPQNPDPAQYKDRLWISATWTADGVHILGLVHQEYHGNTHPGRCVYATYGQCWYNTIDEVNSSDGGRDFSLENHVFPVAALNMKSEDEQGRPRGFFEPSNLIARDGWLYTLINTTGGGDQHAGVCLFRTERVKYDNWQTLTDNGWIASRSDPYRGKVRPPCKILPNLYGPIHSLVFYQKTKQYIAIMTMPGGAHKGAFAFSISDDLQTWTVPQVFADLKTTFSRVCAPKIYSYPSIIDLGSPDRNFTVVGSSALFFAARQNRGSNGCAGTVNRDLVYFHLSIESD